MKHLPLLLTAAALLAGMTVDYVQTRSNARMAVQQAAQIQRLRVNQERLQVWVSHAQSWAEEKAAR